VNDIFKAWDICYTLYNLADISFIMYLQGEIKQITSQMEADKADLQTQLSSAVARFEESENRRHVAESKLTELQTLHKDLDLRYRNLQASHNAKRSQLEQKKTRESAATKRATALSKPQVIGSCRSD
jgi:chromosome segregation ATPase